jgi:hypothetical protein
MQLCNQCAQEINLPTGNLASITKKKHIENGFLCIAICDECGPTYITSNGNCRSNCIRNHKRWKTED